MTQAHGVKVRLLHQHGLVLFDRVKPGDNRFTRFENVELTAHTAGVTIETIEAMSRMAAESAADVLAGRQPHGLVNPEAWERRRR